MPASCLGADSGTTSHCSYHHIAGKKKASDPFARKDWYDIKAPSSFNVRQVGKTLVTRTTGTKVGSSSSAREAAAGGGGEGPWPMHARRPCSRLHAWERVGTGVQDRGRARE